MEVTFLGTSAGWPLPRLGCNCIICSSKSDYDKRSRPSILINKEILVDAPIDIYSSFQKQNINPTLIKYLLITHAHDDHIMGLYDLSRIYGKKEKITLISSRGIIESIKNKYPISLRTFKVKDITPGISFKILGNSYIQFVPVEHGGTEAYALKIKSPKPIVYAVEFRRIIPSSKKLIGDVDLAIIDGSSKSFVGQAKGHETIEEGVRLGKEINAKKILFTNNGHKTDTHQNLVSFVTRLGNIKYSIAYDGLILKV